MYIYVYVPHFAAAPPKPQRPPKEMIDNKMMVMAANHHRDGRRPQTWNSNMFQNHAKGKDNNNN